MSSIDIPVRGTSIKSGTVGLFLLVVTNENSKILLTELEKSNTIDSEL